MDFPERVQAGSVALRHFVPSDAPRVQLLAGDWDVAKSTAALPHPYLDGMAEAWIAGHAEGRSRGTELPYAITRVDDGALVGSLGLRPTANEHGHFGYWIGKPYWGAGHATAATRAAIALLFARTDLDLLWAIHLAENRGSWRVMEKSGMRVLRRQTHVHRGEAREFYVRGITRAVWEGLTDPLLYRPFTASTARLVLEILTPAHAPLLAAGLSDPALYAWIDQEPPDLAFLTARFARICTPQAPNGQLWLNWAVRRLDGEYVGLIEATVHPDRQADIAYFIFAAQQRSGYACEACRAMIGHLVADYGVHAIHISTDTHNVASQRLAEALGFAHDGPPQDAGTLRGAPALDYRYTYRPGTGSGL